MKKMRRVWGLLALSVSLSLTACQKDETPEPENLEFASAEFQLPDLTELATPEVSPGSDTAPFACTPREGGREKLEALGRALQRLDLDGNQRTAVRGFVREHQSCIAGHVSRVQDLHKELVAKANAKREEYAKAYRAGRITKAQLEERLAKLRTDLKEDLARHEGKEAQMRALRKCRQELLRKIESILSPAQLRKWDSWKNRLG